MSKEKKFVGLGNVCYVYDPDTGKLYEAPLGKPHSNPKPEKGSNMPPDITTPSGKQELIQSTGVLRNDIQDCLGRLVGARLFKNKQQETEALLRMESLMVSAAQQLQCIIDYLKEEK